MKASAKDLHAALNARLLVWYRDDRKDGPDPGGEVIEGLLETIHQRRVMEDKGDVKVELTRDEAAKLGHALRDVGGRELDLLGVPDRVAVVRLKHRLRKFLAT